MSGPQRFFNMHGKSEGTHMQTRFDEDDGDTQDMADASSPLVPSNDVSSSMGESLSIRHLVRVCKSSWGRSQDGIRFQMYNARTQNERSIKINVITVLH